MEVATFKSPSLPRITSYRTSIFDPEVDRETDPLYVLDRIKDPDEKKRVEKKYKGLDLVDKINFVTVNDDKEKFVELVKTKHPESINHENLWDLLFHFDSFRCVTAVLDGETRPLLYLPAFLEDKTTPLQFAASTGSYRLTKLLLDRGFEDVVNSRDSNNQLPLNLAVEPRWKDVKYTLFEHIAALCGWKMRDLLETVRILASCTKDVQQEFFAYASKGCVQEVVTLLLAAPEKVMPPGSNLKQQLLDGTASLVFLDVGSAAVGFTEDLTSRRMSMPKILALVEIFERMAPRLSAYLRNDQMKGRDNVYNEVAKVFEDAGISVSFMDEYVSNLSYRSLSELFSDERIPPTYLKYDVDSSDRAIELLNPKVPSELEGFICADDSHSFVNCVMSKLKTENSANGRELSVSEWVKSFFVPSKVKTENSANGSEFPVSKLVESICLYRAVGCATSLLEGRTGLSIQLNSALKDGMFPLHLSAMSLSPGLTQLFLDHGAWSNVQCSKYGSPYNELFPLDLALRALCLHQYVSDWTPKKSIFKLIYIFCTAELIEPLKTIELLASDPTVVQKIGLRCVQEGNMVELAALLMVSWDILVVPGANGEIDSSFIGKHILGQLQMVMHQEAKLFYSRDTGLFQEVRQKKGALLFASSMLHILKSARATLEDYRLSARAKDIANHEVPIDVSNLLKDLGFCLKSNDVDVSDMKCLLPEVEPEPSDVTGDRETDSTPGLKPQISSENTEKPIGDDCFGGSKEYIPSTYSAAMTSSMLQWKPSPNTHSFGKVPLPVQPHAKTLHLVRNPSHVSPGNKLARLASYAKRYIRYF